MAYNNHISQFKNMMYSSYKDLLSFFKSVTMTKIDMKEVWNKIVKTLTPPDELLAILCIVVFLSLNLFIIRRFVIIMRARNCKVTYGWLEEKAPRIGDLAVFKVSFPRAPNPEETSRLLKDVRVQVLVDHEEIVVEKDASDTKQTIFLKFRIRKSGMYEIRILYNGFPVCGSPFTTMVEPDGMDPSLTVIDWTTPIVLTQGRMSTFDILPKDAYGNRCPGRSDDINRLSFDFKELLRVNDPDPDTNAMPKLKYSFAIRRDFSHTDRAMAIISFHLKSEVVGVFRGKVKYNGTPLHSQDFVFVAISTKEEAIVLNKEKEDRNFSSTFCDEFKATMANGLEVVVELSPRFVYLKESVYQGLLAKRIATFRVCKMTMVEIQSISQTDGIEMYKIKLVDDVQNQIQILDMTASDGRIFVALIFRFCSTGKNDFLNFETKRMDLYKQLRDINPENPRLLMQDQLQGAPNGNLHHTIVNAYKVLQISRYNIVTSTEEQTGHFTREDWGKPFIVSFNGETVQTDKPAWVDWSETLLDTFFQNNSHGMFCSLGTTGLLHPNPNRHSRWTRAHYELAGKVVGKYLVETALSPDGAWKYFTNSRFSRSFLAQILSLKPTYKHMELDEPEVYASTILPLFKTSVTRSTFIGPVYDNSGNMITPELIPNGSTTAITENNIVTYVNAIANLRLAANVQEEVEAFVSGLSILIPNDLLMAFDENELELILCGSSEFSLKEIQKYHSSNDLEWNPFQDRIKKWLWDCLQGMSPVDIGRFYQFVTGSSRLPTGGLSELRPRLKITVTCLFGQLPTANKTLHQLYLTDHPSYEDFSVALLLAIRCADEKHNFMAQS